MKKLVLIIIALALLLPGCSYQQEDAQIAATTLPVYEFTLRLCEGTGLSVTRLVTESVSCLHDYSLQVRQMRAIESAELIVLSGAGLEEFLEEALTGAENTLDASENIPLICGGHEHDHGEENEGHSGHHHENDPHIWLSPSNAKIMAQNICAGLSAQYPQHSQILSENLSTLLDDLDALNTYGQAALADLNCREMITFHDGFAYMAEAFDLTILEAVEEESGSEPSAEELIHLIEITEHHNLPAIFTERNGSVSAAQIISAETGVPCYALDMAMAGDSYFEAMYHNIDILKEALG